MSVNSLPRKEDRPRGDTAWHVVGDPGEPAFENSWTNYGSFGDCAFFKDDNGFVHLQGLVKSGSSGNSTIFTLPEGYRPRSPNDAGGTPGQPTILFGGQLNASNNAVARIDVYGTTGAVACQSASTTWLTLAGCTFYAGWD